MYTYVYENVCKGQWSFNCSIITAPDVCNPKACNHLFQMFSPVFLNAFVFDRFHG